MAAFFKKKPTNQLSRVIHPGDDPEEANKLIPKDEPLSSPPATSVAPATLDEPAAEPAVAAPVSNATTDVDLLEPQDTVVTDDGTLLHGSQTATSTEPPEHTFEEEVIAPLTVPAELVDSADRPQEPSASADLESEPPAAAEPPPIETSEQAESPQAEPVETVELPPVAEPVEPDPLPQPDETEPEPQPAKKAGFWSRLFGGGPNVTPVNPVEPVSMTAEGAEQTSLSESETQPPFVDESASNLPDDTVNNEVLTPPQADLTEPAAEVGIAVPAPEVEPPVPESPPPAGASQWPAVLPEPAPALDQIPPPVSDFASSPDDEHQAFPAETEAPPAPADTNEVIDVPAPDTAAAEAIDAEEPAAETFSPAEPAPAQPPELPAKQEIHPDALTSKSVALPVAQPPEPEEPMGQVNGVHHRGKHKKFELPAVEQYSLSEIIARRRRRNALIRLVVVVLVVCILIVISALFAPQVRTTGS